MAASVGSPAARRNASRPRAARGPARRSRARRIRHRRCRARTARRDMAPSAPGKISTRPASPAKPFASAHKRRRLVQAGIARAGPWRPDEWEASGARLSPRIRLACVNGLLCRRRVGPLNHPLGLTEYFWSCEDGRKRAAGTIGADVPMQKCRSIRRTTARLLSLSAAVVLAASLAGCAHSQMTTGSISRDGGRPVDQMSAPRTAGAPPARWARPMRPIRATSRRRCATPACCR